MTGPKRRSPTGTIPSGRAFVEVRDVRHPRDPREERLPRNVFGERHELTFAVRPVERPVRAEEREDVVVSAVFHGVGADDEFGVHALCERAESRAQRRGRRCAEIDRNHRFGPDDDLRPGRRRFARERRVSIDRRLEGSRRKLQSLCNVALDRGDAIRGFGERASRPERPRECGCDGDAGQRRANVDSAAADRAHAQRIRDVRGDRTDGERDAVRSGVRGDRRERRGDLRVAERRERNADLTETFAAIPLAEREDRRRRERYGRADRALARRESPCDETDERADEGEPEERIADRRPHREEEAEWCDQRPRRLTEPPKADAEIDGSREPADPEGALGRRPKPRPKECHGAERREHDRVRARESQRHRDGPERRRDERNERGHHAPPCRHRLVRRRYSARRGVRP